MPPLTTNASRRVAAFPKAPLPLNRMFLSFLWLESEPGGPLQLLGELAADRVDDIDLTRLQSGKPGRVVGDHLEHQAFDARGLAPILLEGLEHYIHTRRRGHQPIRTGTDRRLFEPVVADLLDILPGHDPAGAGRRSVEGHEIGPGRF